MITRDFPRKEQASNRVLLLPLPIESLQSLGLRIKEYSSSSGDMVFLYIACLRNIKDRALTFSRQFAVGNKMLYDAHPVIRMLLNPCKGFLHRAAGQDSSLTIPVILVRS